MYRTHSNSIPTWLAIISSLFWLLTLSPATLNGQSPTQADPPATPKIDKQASDPAPGNTVEHWDELPLAGNSLTPTQPLVGEKDHLPEFTRELISISWRNNDPIDLYIIRPTGVTKPPLMVMLYGYPADTDKFREDALCKNLASHGFAAVGFVSALTGHRYHDRTMKNWFVSELQESLAVTVHDVQMVLNYMASRGDVDMDRVGIYGQGSGGTIAILSAAVDPRIKAVDVMDPWGDWPEWLAKSLQIPEDERANYLKPEFLAKVAPLEPARWIPRLKGRPFRLQENLFNKAIPDEVRKQIEAAATAGDAQVVEYRDIAEYREKVVVHGKMLDWMQSRIPSTENPASAKEIPRDTVKAVPTQRE